jgi:hypothetical protein
MEIRQCRDETIVFAYRKYLAFTVKYVGLTNEKQLPLHSIPISPAALTSRSDDNRNSTIDSDNNNNSDVTATINSNNENYYKKVKECFYLNYGMELKDLNHIGIIESNNEKHEKKRFYIVSGEISGTNTIPHNQIPNYITSFSFVEIEQIVQKILHNVSDFLFAACCLFKIHYLKYNKNNNKYDGPHNESNDSHKKIIGSTIEGNINKEFNRNIEHYLKVIVDKNAAINYNLEDAYGPTIKVTELKLLKPYIRSDDDATYDITNGNNMKNTNYCNNHIREKLSDNSSLLLEKDIDTNNDNNDEKIKKNRLPTLQELGFGEQVPRKTKVDNWLNKG